MTDNDKLEFIGQIIDIFEDFLARKEYFNTDSEETAIIYGNDYYELENALKDMMYRWNIM